MSEDTGPDLGIEKATAGQPGDAGFTSEWQRAQCYKFQVLMDVLREVQPSIADGHDETRLQEETGIIDGCFAAWDTTPSPAAQFTAIALMLECVLDRSVDALAASGLLRERRHNTPERD